MTPALVARRNAHRAHHRAPFASPPRRGAPERARRAVLALAVVALFALCGCAPRGAAAGGTTIVARPAVAACPALPPGPAAMLDSERIPVGGSPALGRPEALVTIVEFSDFECPFCERVEPTLMRLQRRYGDDLRLVFKHNPLPFHPHAAAAAEAAAAAHAQGRFWQMQAMLFANNRALERADLERYAEAIGLDMARFRRDLDEHKYAPVVRADMDLAQQLGAQGTPNFFINGTNVVGAQPYERFAAVIDQVLARARMLRDRPRVYAAMVRDPVPADGVAAPTPPPRPSAPAPPELDPSTVYNVPVAGHPSRGPADALVTVAEFADFQCPFSSRVQATLAQLRRQYGPRVRVVWFDQPLEFHQNAMPAAEAAREAFAQQGAAGFWRMHDTLFANQQALSRADLERYARAQGLDMARFRSALDQHVHQPAIERDRQLAQSIAANGTPHFFVNGQRLVGAQPFDRFDELVSAGERAAQAQVGRGTARARVYAALTANGATAPVYRSGAAAGGDGSAAAAGQGGGAGGADDPAGPNARIYVVPANPRAPARGPVGAPVVIEHFADFQCPFCSRVAPTLDQIARQYGNRVRIVWRHYPLPFHTNAMAAAEAALEAQAQQGAAGFWRMHDTLFQNQQALSRADLERYALAQGLDMARFRRALDQHAHAAAIRADMAAADGIRVPDGGIGTPASFVNGRFVSGAQPFSEFQRVIDAALAAAQRGAAH